MSRYFSDAHTRSALNKELSYARRSSQFLRALALLLLVGMCEGIFTSTCSGQASPRPVVFVHGVMGDSAGWGDQTDPQNLRGNLISRLASSSLGYTNTASYEVYYDGIAVLYSVTGNPQDDRLAVESIPASARFFTIRFYSNNSADPFNKIDATKISILNKASELAHVLEAISQITHVQESVLVAHSQGGLVARAYLENLGSANPCNEILYQTPCTPGEVAYAQNVAHVITLDSPFGGGDYSGFITAVVSLTSTLLRETPINTFELRPDSVVLRAINYQSGVAGILPQPLPLSVTIDSIVSYLSDLGYPCPDDSSPTCFSDDVVESRSQAIRQNIAPAQLTPNLVDLGNPISANDPQITQVRGILIGLGGCWPALPGSPFRPPSGIVPQGVLLHSISCTGHVTSTQDAIYQSVFAHAQGVTTTVTVQATLDGSLYTGPVNYQLVNQGVLGTTIEPGPALPHIFVDVPLGLYTLSGISGPSSNFSSTTTGFSHGTEIETNRLGFDAAANARITDLFISIDFRSNPATPPTVNTSPATGQQCDTATLNEVMTSNGSAANVYFEWGTSSLLSSFGTTPSHLVPGTNGPTAFNFSLTGLTCNTNYFYRAVADNGGGPVRGSIATFTTLATLPKPVLFTPANGSIGVQSSPSFTWSPVNGATSYRLIVATNPNALPLDPTAPVCGSGCVFNVTPASMTYTPAAGTLSAGTYYWEVHGRSPSQFGDWSAISSFSVGTPVANDFSVQTSPASQTASVGGSVGYSISTATTSGSPQTIALSAANLPAGVSAFFTPNILTSGQSADFGISTSSMTPPGNYNLTILASGSSTTHTANVQLVVNSNTGTAAVTFSPTSLSFSDQTLFTNSPSQLVNFINTGTAPLQVLSIVGDNNFAVVNPCVNTLPPGTRCTFSVVFDPSQVGAIAGKVQLFFVGPTSPAVLTLRGTGLAPAPTTGTIQVFGTLNGSPLPNTQQFSYPFSYSLAGPDALTGGGAATFTADPGTYTISFSGSPSTFTLTSVTPSATQAVTAGSVTTFTLNFTAPNDFFGPFFFNPLSQVVVRGRPASYAVGLSNPPAGNASTPITLQVSGAPAGSIASFNPQQTNSGLSSALAVTTDSTLTPAGAYTLRLTGTNSSGLVHPGSGTASLIVTNAPVSPVQLISQSSSGIQANAAARYSTNSATSADGRFVVFVSSASNLATNANGFNQVYVRDRQVGTTSLVSINNTGVIANNDALTPTISADGRYVAFASGANNLPQAPTNGSNAIYVRDLQLGQIERVDVSAGGRSNGVGLLPCISADGRFVAFESNATNLTPEATTGSLQIFTRDRTAGVTSLASLGIDGLQANGSAFAPTLNADGRYIAFFSNSSNLVAASTGGRTQVYLRDMQAGTTTLVSVGADGLAANGLIFANGASPGLSADGRFVVFVSNATNLVPGAIDGNGDSRAFERDTAGQTVKVVDVDATGVPLAQGGFNPTISADGRFVTYQIYNQTLIRDMSTNQSIAVSVAPDGTAQNSGIDQGNPPSISYNGSTVVFGSNATNLIAGDSNAVSDVFAAQNPLLGTPFATAISLDTSSANGGTSVGGTITLSGPAPASGATVSLSSNNAAVTVPSVSFIPPGATSGRFAIDAEIVPKETVLTILASYNGGAAASVLSVQPAPNLEISPGNWDFGPQTVGIASPANTFTISNSGTASLGINSVGMGTGQVFSISTNTCGLTLQAGSTCSISIIFDPASAGLAIDFLQISFGNPADTRSVQLLGTGAVPNIVLSSEAIDFGAQPVLSNTQRTVTVTNLGNAVLTGIQVSVTGVNSSDFSIVRDDCSNTTLSANTSCLVAVVFGPSAAGPRTASLTLSSNAAGSPKTANLVGTGAAPAVNLSTTAISFPNQPVGTSSALQAVTVQNTGTASLPISSIVLTGPNASDFSKGNTCDLALAAGANCTISIVFTPSASGTRTASVTLTDSLGVQSIALTGMGIAPAISLSTTALTFASQLVGTSSTSQGMTIQNTGTAPLPITSVALSGANASDFSQTNTCGTNLFDGASCTITIVFTPTAAGSQTATVVLTDSLGVQTIDLTGTAVAPAVSLSAVTLPFANQPVSTSSAPQAVVMQNTGTAPFPITSISLTGPNAGDFSQTNTCGTSLSAGASCTVSVIFTPSSFGNKTAALVLTDSVGTQSVDVSGTGTAALAALSPASLAFPNQPVGTPSAAQVISLTNGGNIALSVTSISVTGVNSSDFAQTNTCGTGVAAGSTCTINVVFTPSSTGSKSASIAVVDSVGTQTTTVGGIGTAPAVSLSSGNLVFANQTVGTSSTAQAVTLINLGNGALSISSISISGANVTDFAQTNTCGTSVAAGASCTISIMFVPTAAGTRTAAITIVDNAGTQSISLTGTGVAAGPVVQLTPTSLSFGVQSVGVVSSVRTINVANTGGAALSITSINVTGTNGTDFTQTNTCGTSVGAGGTCIISVTFKPAAAGPRSAAITLQDGVGAQTVPLDGIGQASLDFSPTSVAFANQALGSTSTTRIVTLTNNTGVLVNFSSIAVTGANVADFVLLSSTCAQTLVWKSSCTVTLAFAPVATGTRTASLTITDDATNNPQRIALSGSGILPVTVTASISFGSQKVGTTSQSKSVTIKNSLPTTLTFSAFSFGGTNPGDFRQSATTCGSTLPAGASCTVSIVFSPTATGPRSAVFNVADNAVTSPQSVVLTGTGK